VPRDAQTFPLRDACINRNIARLTCQANQQHMNIIAWAIKSAAENLSRAFFVSPALRESGFVLSKPFRRIFRNSFTVGKAFDTSGKSRA
jgi:hypothetical protein